MSEDNPTTGKPEEPAKSASQPAKRSQAEEFLEEAEGIADFGFQTGLVSDANLASAIEKAKKLPPQDRTFDRPEMIDVYQRVVALRTKIPPSTVAAIKTGWRPNKDKKRETLTNVVFVAIAVFVMLAVGHLTLIHSRGTALAADLIRLDEANPGLQFGILERRLLRAQEAIFTEAKAAQQPGELIDKAETIGAVKQQPDPAESSQPSAANDEEMVGPISLAQDSVLRDAYDLSVLDLRLRSARLKTNELMAEAYNPYPRLAAAYGGILYTLDSALDLAKKTVCHFAPETFEMCAFKGLPINQSIVDRYAANYGSLNEQSLPIFCGYLDKIREMTAKKADAKAGLVEDAGIVGGDYFLKIRHVFDDRFGYSNIDLVTQNCSIGLNYVWNTIPDVRRMIEDVKSVTTLYAFIILPSLYGALGSFMYFLRRSLDPYSPTLSILRMSYRIAIGGLAGLAVAYFWSGADMTSSTFISAGFGLFLVAFVFGFSVEVFFSFLDRLVELSAASVKNIGTSPPPKDAGGAQPA